MQRAKAKNILQNISKQQRIQQKKDNQTLNAALCQSSASIFASPWDFGPPMSRTAFEIGRWLRFVKSELKR
jgi:hypothetical protein